MSQNSVFMPLWVKRFTVVASAMFAAASHAQHADREVSVLRSDERSLVFEYRPQYAPKTTITEGNKEFTLFDFVGSVPTITERTTGSPDLRHRMFPVGFPSKEGNTVQVVAADYEDVPNIMVAPVPSLRVRDDMIEVDRYAVRSDKYSENAFVPHRVAELTTIGQSRSMLLGSVRVYPIRYNPATRTLRKYNRLVIEVVFGSAQGSRVQNQDDLLFKDVLLNHEVAKTWKFGTPKRLERTPTPSVLATGDWYRIPISEEGVYVLNAQYLSAAGIDIGSINPQTIKIYGNGGTEVPENITLVRPQDLVENAIYVEGEGDGRFDGTDYVLFFGKSTRGWRYNSSTQLFDHYINRYSETNYYWLTHGGAQGKRMQEQDSLATAPTVTPDRFTDLIAVEQEAVNILRSGKNWYGPSMNPSGAQTYVNALHGMVANDNILYRYSIITRSEGSPSLTVTEGAATIAINDPLPIVSYSNIFTIAREMTFQKTVSTSSVANTSQLKFTFNSNSIAASAWIDWVEIQYPRNFLAVNDYLRFRSPDTSAIVEYRLQGFSPNPFILNVTNPTDVRRIVGAQGGFTVQENAGQVSEYCAAGLSSFKVPGPMQRIANQNLRGITEGADFIILTSPEFRTAADRLRGYREQPEHGDLRTIVVDVNEIYNEFGGGIPDITAIRDFLKYAYDNWTRQPRFVLMFGGGSYDYKSVLGFRSSYVPTWQSEGSLDDIFSSASDDFFVKFDSGSDLVSLVTGRISSRNGAEANLVVDKLIRYEENSVRDPWKMRALFVGDDSWTPEREDGTIHSAQAEVLAEQHTPKEFEKKKIYIAEFPTVITAQGRRKPGAFQAIIDQINQGVLVVAYAGHGNPTVWAHESIFSILTSIPQLTNANKLTVFFLATCNFSQFDDPGRYTGSELLMNKPDGGAIGVVSATRKVFAGQNAAFNRAIFDRLFLTDQFGRVAVERPATAIFQRKAISNNTNDQKFFYMGDPTMRLQYPVGFASIDTVNGESIDSINGDPRLDSDPIQLRALSKVTVKGSIRDTNNMPESSFSGTMLLVLNDATRRVTITNFPPGSSWPYLSTGGTIFRGENSVTNGRFSATFVVPKDIAYADSTTRGRLVTYFSSDDRDGAGYTGKVRVGGTDTSVAVDIEGPTIDIYLDSPSRSFRAGDLVSERPVLYVDIADSSGINTSGSGIGHRLEAWVNNSAQSKDVTEFYSSKLDKYREGTVQYQMESLPHGRNFVRVRAWDTFNNASTAETFFEVTSSEQLRISDVMNYPNPFARNTSFTFRQNQLIPLDIKIKVYTLAGRLIQSLESSSPGEPFIRVPWDGRDQDGDVLANGVYLYKLIVRTIDGRFSSEALGKLSVLK